MNASSWNHSHLFQFDSVDNLLDTFGQTWLYNILHLCLYLPTGLTSFALNLLSWITFLDSKKFNAPLFSYLRVYSLVNAVLSLLGAFRFLPHSYRIFEFSNSLWVNVWLCYVYVPLTGSLNLYTNLLSILIQLDRIALYSRIVKQKWTRLMSPYSFCLASFLFVLIINAPTSVNFHPIEYAISINSTRNYTIWLDPPNELLSTKTWSTVIFMIVGLREFVAMVVEISLDIIVVVCIKRHIAKKRRLNPTHGGRTSQSVSSQSYGSSNSAAELRMTVTTVVISIISVIHHLIQLSCVISIRLTYNSGVFYTCLASNYFVLVRSAADVLTFLTFNSKFRQSFLTFGRL